MNPASFSDRRLFEAEPRAGVVRLIRRLCVLREQGDTDAAERLRRTELERAIAEYRGAHGPEALPEEELQALFAAEERRVAEAAILCELLLPQLRGALPAATTAASRTALREAAVARVASSAPAGPPAITDLLDAMLAAERPGRLTAAAPREP